MSWDRKQRQEAILREKIAVIVLERMSDPRLGFVTITGVELSRDKRHAKVTYTVMGTESEQRRTARALDDSTGRVQELLAPTLRMRSMPELRFVLDKGVQKESRLLGLIEDLASQRAEEEAAGLIPAEGEEADGDAAGADGDAAGADGEGDAELAAEPDPAAAADPAELPDDARTPDLADAADPGDDDAGDELR